MHARYGRVEALHGIDLQVHEGEFVTVLGPNGAGKTTLMRAITRTAARSGTVRFQGHDVSALHTHQLASRGVILVQEGRGLFGGMTVAENLEMGGFTQRDRGATQRRLGSVFALFPRLRERLGQLAASLSGGEQQMLAIGRALMANPKLLMLDEPSVGLAPRVAVEIVEALGELNRNGLGILLVEQKAPLALRLARRAYIITLGRVAAELDASEIGSHHDLARYYLA